MVVLVRFLKPSRYKLIFLVEWTMFLILTIVQSRFLVKPVLINLLWPIIFFYLVGCGLVAASRSERAPLKISQLLSAAVLLAILDHILKMAVVSQLTVGESIPIVLNRLHLVHAQNTTGSWVAAVMGSGPVVLPLLVFACVFLVFTPLMYRFYSVRHRQSFWSETVFVCLIAGLASAVADLAFRGLVVDYIGLPGLFAADLKDILLFVFVGSFLVEALDNPRISFRWNGWRGEIRDLLRLVTGFTRFAVSELLKLGRCSE